MTGKGDPGDEAARLTTMPTGKTSDESASCDTKTDEDLEAPQLKPMTIKS
jgi:hypothetical protein